MSKTLPASRLARCVRAFYLLQSGVGFTAGHLAREFNVSSRTVFRDFQAMKAAGLPLRHDEQAGGHVITPNARFRLASLDDDELAVLLLAASMSCLASSHHLGGIVRQSVHKVVGQVSQDLRGEVANLLRHCVIDQLSPRYPNLGDERERTLAQVLLAIRKRRSIRIVYAQPDHSHFQQRTKLSPYRLMVSTSGCSIIGRSSVHRRVRSFEVDAIAHAELTDDPFTVPLKYLRPMHMHDVSGFRGAESDPDALGNLVAR